MTTFPTTAIRGATIALALSLLAACGSDGTSTAPAATGAPTSPATEPGATSGPTDPPATDAPTPTDAPTTTVERTTTTISGPPLVTGNVLTPGTYRSQRFAPFFDFTTTAEWDIFSNSGKTLTLQRDDGQVVVWTVGILPGATPDEVLADVCPGGTIDLGQPTSTTLLGLPARQVTGRVSAQCTIDYSESSGLLIFPGETERVVAVAVGDQVLVVISTSGVSDVATHTAEVDAILASMTPASA